jgi:hypothetical protein
MDNQRGKLDEFKCKPALSEKLNIPWFDLYGRRGA